MLSGDIGKAVTLQGIGVTKGARAAIEAAGGKIIEPEAAPPKRKLVKKAVNKEAKTAMPEAPAGDQAADDAWENKPQDR